MKEIKLFILKRVMRNDLMKHFFVGTLFALILHLFNLEPNLIMFLCFGLGVGKEVYDLVTKGKASGFDILYTLLPSVLIHLILL